MSIRSLSINLATVRQQFTLRQAVDACVAQGISAIAPWRDQIEAAGLKEAAEIIRSNTMRVTCLCRGGMFPAADKELAAAIDDNKRAMTRPVRLAQIVLYLLWRCRRGRGILVARGWSPMASRPSFRTRAPAGCRLRSSLSIRCMPPTAPALTRWNRRWTSAIFSARV